MEYLIVLIPRFLNAMTLIKSCPSVSVSIRDREKCMNAIEWLEYRIGANKEQLESDSDSQIRSLIRLFIKFKFN